MEIIKTSDNQIKCTLDIHDLEVRRINLDKISYGSEESRALVEEMMRVAAEKFDFRANDLPLVVEAIPYENKLVFLITRVEFPEELDTRFSRFTDADEDEYQVPEAPGYAEDNSSNFFSHLDNAIKEAKKITRKVRAEEKPENEITLSDKKKPAPVRMIYAFRSMDELIFLATVITKKYHLPSSVYRAGANSSILLLVSQGDNTPEQYRTICDIISEYSCKDRRSSGSDAFLMEHYTPILAENALEVLASL